MPSQVSSFVGRQRAITELRRLLVSTRLLTLTGPGGIGKTRLALTVAEAVFPDYADGVWLVELAPLVDPTLVPATLANALGIRESHSPVIDQLEEALRSRATLLVLDNCEHLVHACAELSERLLRSARNVQILATSREPLGIFGEVVWRVPGLTGPAATEPRSSQVPVETEAVRLFVERAQAAAPRFRLTDNVGAVADICRQLDGIPLAIELAAARIKVLTPEQIGARIGDPFCLLVSGSRNAPRRHQTLRATVDWSYELLTQPEQTLFNRLSVFAGGCTLVAAEAVCADPEQGDQIGGQHMLDLMARLVDHSLVEADPSAGTIRYRLTETLRQYAAQRLRETSQEPVLRDRHLDWSVAFAEAAAPALTGPDQRAWLACIKREHDNMRAALAWSLENLSHAGLTLRLAAALHRFWWWHGHLVEGRTWLARALEGDSRVGEAAVPTTLYARLCAIRASGVLARQQGDYSTADNLFAQSLALARELNDSVAIAECLYWRGSNLFRLGDEKQAQALAEQSVAMWRRLGDRAGTCRPLGTLANLALVRGNYEHAIALHEERLLCAREAGDTLEIARVYRYLGMLAGEQHQYDRATHLLEASYKAFGDLEYPEGMARALASLAWIAHAQGERSLAQQRFGESLVAFHKLGATWGIAECLAGLARSASNGGQLDVAAQLFGSVAMLRETHNIRLADDQVAERAAGTRAATLENDQEAVRAVLGKTRFESFWRAGHGLTVDDAVFAALAIAPANRRIARAESDSLTRRELEVAALVVRGRSNREIASELVIAVSTAERHVANILAKLGLGSRTQIAAWFLEQAAPGLLL